MNHSYISLGLLSCIVQRSIDFIRYFVVLIDLVHCRCEGLLRGASEPESAQALQEPDVLSVGELLGAIALKEPIISSPSSSPQAVPEDNIDAVPSGCCLSSSPGSVIWVHKPPEGRRGSYHIRMDRSGLFHTYPDMGGPFLSLNEAQDAFTSHLNILYPPLK
jgi:hypothetical protein